MAGNTYHVDDIYTNRITDMHNSRNVFNAFLMQLRYGWLSPTTIIKTTLQQNHLLWTKIIKSDFNSPFFFFFLLCLFCQHTKENKSNKRTSTSKQSVGKVCSIYTNNYVEKYTDISVDIWTGQKRRTCVLFLWKNGVDCYWYNAQSV